jgi:hypothetical protein
MGHPGIRVVPPKAALVPRTAAAGGMAERVIVAVGSLVFHVKHSLGTAGRESLCLVAVTTRTTVCWWWFSSSFKE